MDEKIIKIYCAPDEQKSKVDYLNNFILEYPNEAEILIKGGLLGHGNEEWHNIAKHCITVAIGGDILAQHLKADCEKIIKAGLLHDWYKRKEVEMMSLFGGYKGYQLTNNEDELLLIKYGVQKDILDVIHANVLKSADQQYLESRPIEQKILHYIDMITSGTEFVNYTERLKIVEQKQHNVEFSESFRPKLGGKSLFELNYEVIDMTQKEFENMMGLQNDTLIDFLKEKFEERLQPK